MRDMGLQGIIRGKSIKTTVSDKAAPYPLDHVNRQFKAPRPNVLWLSDFTSVATWTGFVYVAFVIDAYARRIVAGGSRARRTPASCSTRWSSGNARKAAAIKKVLTREELGLHISGTRLAARETPPVAYFHAIELLARKAASQLIPHNHFHFFLGHPAPTRPHFGDVDVDEADPCRLEIRNDENSSVHQAGRRL
jgi:hypothetical protein